MVSYSQRSESKIKGDFKKMNNRVEEVKELIEQIFGDAIDAEEICLIYAELFNCIKEQMQYAIKALTLEK